jgi:hypothetical protein
MEETGAEGSFDHHWYFLHGHHQGMRKAKDDIRARVVEKVAPPSAGAYRSVPRVLLPITYRTPIRDQLAVKEVIRLPSNRSGEDRRPTDIVDRAALCLGSL